MMGVMRPSADAGTGGTARAVPARRSQSTRRHIIDAARAVFFEAGFERANLDEVARRAGIAKGTIYRYFASKAELYVEVLVSTADLFDERMKRALDPSLGASDQIRQLARFSFEHYTKQSEYFRIFWAIENQGLIGDLPAELVRTVTELWKRSLGHVAGVIERGIRTGEFAPCDAWEVANIFWVATNAVIQTAEVEARRELWDRDMRSVFEHTLELLLRGMQAGSA